MLGITVKKTDGSLWAATQITATADEANNPCVSFLCSGVMRTFLMSDVSEITARMPEVKQEEKGPDA